ncbi:hypothetical protein [uncultured Litoreibacter sp.]|uniref:hypothetical protein n=1 Tax=uncultured Litoreibacter sp. TaxID=1392394 RepID=UPI0026234665|nr:hypothetical protein [uncultured Litoreibacter sp.]
MSDSPQLIIAKSILIGSHDHMDPADGDSYVTIHLYQAEDGRFFRHIEASGMNSVFSGAEDFIEWLGTSYDDSWKLP